MNQRVTAQEWFALGERVPYDYEAKTMLKESGAESANSVNVFRWMGNLAARFGRGECQTAD